MSSHGLREPIARDAASLRTLDAKIAYTSVARIPTVLASLGLGTAIAFSSASRNASLVILSVTGLFSILSVWSFGRERTMGRISEALAVLAIALLGVVPAVPTPTDGILLACLAGVLLASILHQPDSALSSKPIPEIFFAYLLLAMLRSRGAPVVHALAPFSLLLLYRLVGRVPLRTWLVGFELGGLVLSARVLWASMGGIGRVTWASLDFIMPLHLIGGLIAFSRVQALLSAQRSPTRLLIAAGVSATIQMAALVVTQTRGLLIALAIGLMVLLRKTRPRLVILWVATLGLAGYALDRVLRRLTPEAAMTMQERFSLAGVTRGFGGRWEETRAAAITGWESPILGRGFDYLYSSAAQADRLTSIHNSLAYHWVVGGAIGLALFLSIWLLMVKRLWPDQLSTALVATLFFYSLTTAGHRSVHFVLPTAILLGHAYRRSSPSFDRDVAELS